MLFECQALCGPSTMIPIQAADRVANFAESHPLRFPRYAVYGAVLGGGDVPE